MDLFSRSNLKADPVKVKQVKAWIAEIFNLDEQVTISLNQLTNGQASPVVLRQGT